MRRDEIWLDQHVVSMRCDSLAKRLQTSDLFRRKLRKHLLTPLLEEFAFHRRYLTYGAGVTDREAFLTTITVRIGRSYRIQAAAGGPSSEQCRLDASRK
jgi:hypothetical protein